MLKLEQERTNSTEMLRDRKEEKVPWLHRGAPQMAQNSRSGDKTDPCTAISVQDGALSCVFNVSRSL